MVSTLRQLNANPPAARSKIAALCVSGRSIYHHLPGVDAYDVRRDARTFDGDCPVIAHPPCRTWSKYLRQLAKPPDRKAEQDLAFFCLEKVIRNGGVLEQPAGSHFWEAANLPTPNAPAQDPFFWTLYVEQSWFGYCSRKPTWLLICGVPRRQMPAMPFTLVQRSQNAGSSFERSRTVTSFAAFLCQIARSSWWQHMPRAKSLDSTAKI